MLIPYEQKNKGISVTPHSSQKHAYISVTTAAGRTEETPAEKADTQSKASSYCSFIATISELVMERIANTPHGTEASSAHPSTCLLFSPFHNALRVTEATALYPFLPHCSFYLSKYVFPVPNTFEC